MYMLYQTTNVLNNKFYIGVSNGNNKYYKGSGTALKAAIKKHGSKSFVTEVLETFATEREAFAREKEVVTAELVNNPECYNVKPGGKGGVGHKKTAEHRQKIKLSVEQAIRNRKKDNIKGGRKPTVPFDETIKIWKKLGQRKGAEYFGISISTFKGRIATAKKNLTEVKKNV